jgi:hypothetical protein
MQKQNDGFYYVMDVDDDCRLRNVFWAHARSRAVSEFFGDIITFDTTDVQILILASARIVCNIVCASARSNPQGNGQILVSCLINLILT